MKNLIIIFVIILLTSCSETSPQKDYSKYKFGVTLYSEGGYSKIYCDSLQMTSVRSAYVWVDGIKLIVQSQNRISVWSN